MSHLLSMFDKNLLQDKVILVTGAGNGIGRQAALSYAAHGATVILLGRTTKKLQDLYDEIIAMQAPTPAIVPLDMLGATKQNYIDMAETIKAEFGRLDGLLNNAALLGEITPFEQISEKEFNEVMQINVTAQLYITQALLPLLQEAPQGRIIFTTSTVGHIGKAYWGSYAISKFAVEGMMQILADETSHSSLKVNAINPGGTRTSMRAKAYPAEDVNKLKTPYDIMPTYLELMSDAYVFTGRCVDAQEKR